VTGCTDKCAHRLYDGEETEDGDLIVADCDCGNWSQVWVAVPEGCCGIGLVRGGDLMVDRQGQWFGLWVRGAGAAPWREAWEALTVENYDTFEKIEAGGVATLDGLIFLVSREEECECVESDYFDTDTCSLCKNTGTVRSWRLERGEVLPEEMQANWRRENVPVRQILEATNPGSVFLVAPSRESWDAGRIGEWGMVERKLLGEEAPDDR
jgi:hypothetical protein